MPRLRLLLLALLTALAVATPASGTSPAAKKQRVDARRVQLQQRIVSARQREAQLSARIQAASTQIAGLEQRVGDVSRQLAPLERDLALHRRRLSALNELLRVETRRLHELKRERRIAVHRLGLRLIQIYESSPPGLLDAVLGSSSLGSLVTQVEVTRDVALQDRQILHAVTRSRDAVRSQWKHTKRTRKQVAAATREVAARTAQVERLRSSLLAQRQQLVSAQAQQQQSASALHESVKQMLDESASLAQVSNELAATIQQAEHQHGGGGGSGHSSSGLIWPANGPVTSPFGERCFQGRCDFHPGIDIGVSSGTPIHAAAAGTVIYAAWMNGYGNLTVVSHGNGLATAYAHQASFAVSNGAQVAQGQVIGYSDCTGYCFGPHLHFEVRVNGQPVNPLNYLP